MINHKRTLYLLSILFIIINFYIFPQETAVKKSDATIPNPLELQPEWWKYFDVDSSTLKTRIVDEIELLTLLSEQLESSETQKTTERLIKQIEAHLNSFAELKSRDIEPHPHVWVPKDSYSIQDYLQVSDEIRSLEQQIKESDFDIEQKHKTLNKINEDFSTSTIEYRIMALPSKEKFIKGLQLLLLKIQQAYLEEEIRLLLERKKFKENTLKAYQKELEVINEKFNLKEIDIQKLEEQKQKIQELYQEAHFDLLDIQVETAREPSPKNNANAALLSLQLIKNLAEQSLYNTRLSFIEGSILLKQFAKGHERDIESVQQELNILKTFYQKTKEQLEIWMKFTRSEIDLSGRDFVSIRKTIVDNEDSISQITKQRLIQALNNMVLLKEVSDELFHLELIINLLESNLVNEQGLLDKTAFYISDWFYSFFYTLNDWFYWSKIEIGDVQITIIGILKAIFILFIAYWVSWFFRFSLKRLLKKRGIVAEPTIYTLNRITHYLILLLGILIALGMIGLTFANFVIILGALGIGIGFGLQNIVNNFICGLTILFARHIKVGDFVELETGEFGKVVEVNVQNTTIHTFDGVDVLVPNAYIIGNKLINWTKKDPYQRLHIPFTVAYGTDQELIHKVIIEMARQMPSTIYGVRGIPLPEVWLVKFGENALDFELVVWVNIYKTAGRSSLKASYLGEIEKVLKNNNITIPYPQRYLHFRSISDEFKDFFRK